ncbi:hypothetical protein CVT25_015027 [Psilocybe cyanescens]|uniref:ADP-ribosylation factor 6 n=1 Tax=Psilocybe cyanescens TaxID=93625 RepID=A0A409VPI4_PSICY|nr:hypothetical protein CVT25_015027 [Psilocybe cyanescens]
MQKQSGDKYLRHVAAFIRANERGLAESGLVRRKPPPPEQSYLAPLGLNWLSPTLTQRPMVFSIDTHHLFYILVKLQAMGFEIGTLDVHIESPSRPMSYANIYPEQKDADTLSLASLRSSFSAVSKLSLGGGWWTAPEPPNTDTELKYIYSSFTKLPSLAICAPGNKVITELLNDSPNNNAIPLDVFKNLQRLECENIDPRTLLGWDRLAESLRSLKIKKSGLEDISQVLIGAVLDDQARRQGRTRQRQPNTDLSSTHHHSTSPTRISDNEQEGGDDGLQANKGKHSSSMLVEELSPLKWTFLKHLYLPDNSLTSFPTAVLRYLTSLTYLDLSSNLLVSIPSGFAELYNLRSLNLSDNLIDSVLGIYLNLGQILSLNLSHNRLDSLCGLERLLALERVDLRHNLLEESSEIGRLVPLPNLTEIWVEGNPLVDIEEGYRVTCFNYFSQEGKEITLDGTQPSLYEKRSLSLPNLTPSTPLNSTSSAPIIAIEHSRGIIYAPSQANDGPSSSSSSTPPPKQRSPLSPLVNPSAPSGTGHRRKKLKRIVELDGSEHSSQLQSYPHSRLGSMDIIREQGLITDTHSGQNAHTAMKADPTPPSPVSHQPPSEPTLPSQRPRHSRHQSEYFPSSDTSQSEQEQASLHAFRYKPVRQGSATLASRSERRRARMSASLFEPSPADVKLANNEGIDSYRQKIESLKQDMGDSWLKVTRDIVVVHMWLWFDLNSRLVPFSFGSIFVNSQVLVVGNVFPYLHSKYNSNMGANLSKAMGKIFGNKEMRLLMLGLDAAGKTTILYKLKLNQSVTTIPTVGFNVETVTYKNVKFNVWDVGGQDKIRPLWRHYYTGTQGLVFVVDSQDRERIDEAKQELHRILSDREMKECLLLVFANKQDLPGAMSPAEVTEKLGLHRMRDRSWKPDVMTSCATTGEGLFEGLQWLSQNVKKRQQ